MARWVGRPDAPSAQGMGDQRVRLAAIAILSGGFAVMLGAASMAAEELAYAGNCALYAREVTGVDLQGNAGDWWTQAEGRYARGHIPATGAILVFRPSRVMPSGHVAVVSRVINKREIQVDQANWIHGRIVKNLWVVDASPNNDWSVVEVENLGSQTYGRQNPTFGFVYPRAPRPQLDEIEVARGDERPVAREFTPIRFAVAIAHPDPGPESEIEPKAVVKTAIFLADKPAPATTHADRAKARSETPAKTHNAAQSPKHEPAKHAAAKHEAAKPATAKREPVRREAAGHPTKPAPKRDVAEHDGAHAKKPASPVKAILATHKVTEALD